MGQRRATVRTDWSEVRQLANQAFSRASGAPLREGNGIMLLRDAAENYPAWSSAIARAESTIHVEMYIIHEDEQGHDFADALLAKAREGVTVRVIYDWLGGFGKTSAGFWHRLRDGGVEVRCYNPPRFDRPFGWVSRDHRKTIVVDGSVAFVTGLCVGRMWVGDSTRQLEPWRDTGIAVYGPAVADVQAAFADGWASAGPALSELVMPSDLPAVGDVALRVVASLPNTAVLFRVDHLVAALARKTLWLTDAYYGGTTAYVQALRAAALDGVDVRLLVPGATDIPFIRPFSRAGYRPLLDAGIRVFEWNGSMMHAKTAVADGQWARVGSTNLNISSWLGNRELDVIVEDERFAGQMESMFLQDLERATEVVLSHNRVRTSSAPPRGTRRHLVTGRTGSGRVAAGAVRVGRTVAAAIGNTRVLESVEAGIAAAAGLVLGLAALVAFAFPRLVAYPVGVVGAWIALALVCRGWALRRRR